MLQRVSVGSWYHLAVPDIIKQMERGIKKKVKLKDINNDDFVPGTMEERISLVWPLTEEAASLSPRHNAKRRLQRHITLLKRRKS